jgi:hypothetical protein
MRRPTHWDDGQLVTDWFFDEVTVYGGIERRLVRWVRTASGWDYENAPLENGERPNPPAATHAISF